MWGYRRLWHRQQLIVRLMEIEDQAQARGAAAGGEEAGRRCLKVHGQIIADVEIHQVCIYRGVDDIQSPGEEKEENGIILVLPVFVPGGAQCVIVFVNDKRLEVSIDLGKDGIGDRSSRYPGGLVVVDDHKRELTFPIPASVIKVGNGRDADSRIDEGQLPVFAIVDLAQAGKDGRTDRCFSRVVLFARQRVGGIRGGLVRIATDAVGHGIGYAGWKDCIAFYIGGDRIVLTAAHDVYR